jgi:hypothetical protein
MFRVAGLVEMSELQNVSKILVKALVLMAQQKPIEKVSPITKQPSACCILCDDNCFSRNRQGWKRNWAQNSGIVSAFFLFLG